LEGGVGDLKDNEEWNGESSIIMVSKEGGRKVRE
jgi:hypothetical protein